MESVASSIIELLISECKDKKVKEGLQAALNVVENSGCITLSDWEEMSEEERLEEAKSYLE